MIAVVPLAALGVVLALWARGADNNTYTQIGIVLLIALASKNAILMTAFSSILGFLPLLFASGAGAASRQAVDNAVVGGMIAATVFALLFVPPCFVLFRTLSERTTKSPESNSVKN